MAREFDFLRSRWPRLAALGNDASRLAEASPSICIKTLNKFCEQAAIMAMEQLKITPFPEDTQEDRLDALKTSGTPAEILQKFHNVLAASYDRNPLGNADAASASLADCQDIGRWLMRQADGGIYLKTGYTAPIPSADMGTRPIPKVSSQDTSYIPRRVEYDPQDTQPMSVRKISGMPSEPSRPVAGSAMQADEDRGYSFMDNFRGGFGRVNWVILAAIVVVIGLIITLLVLLSRHDPAASNFPTASPTPPNYTVPVATLIPTASPTPDPGQYIVYADELDVSVAPEDIATYFKGRWSANQYSGAFQIGDHEYEHGVGLFIKSRAITGHQESVSLFYNLNGNYSQMIFDLGAEANWSYGDEAENGTFRVMVFLDDSVSEIYDSGFHDGTFIDRNVTLDVSGAQTVRIKLFQTKGTEGTLNVVLGDLRMMLTEEAFTNGVTTPTATPDITGTVGATSTPPAGSASPSPSPSPSPTPAP